MFDIKNLTLKDWIIAGLVLLIIALGYKYYTANYEIKKLASEIESLKKKIESGSANKLINLESVISSSESDSDSESNEPTNYKPNKPNKTIETFNNNQNKEIVCDEDICWISGRNKKNQLQPNQSNHLQSNQSNHLQPNQLQSNQSNQLQPSQLQSNQSQLQPNQSQLQPNQLQSNQSQIQPNQSQIQPNQLQSQSTQSQIQSTQSQIQSNQTQFDQPNQSNQIQPNQSQQMYPTELDEQIQSMQNLFQSDFLPSIQQQDLDLMKDITSFLTIADNVVNDVDEIIGGNIYVPVDLKKIVDQIYESPETVYEEESKFNPVILDSNEVINVNPDQIESNINIQNNTEEIIESEVPDFINIPLTLGCTVETQETENQETEKIKSMKINDLKNLAKKLNIKLTEHSRPKNRDQLISEINKCQSTNSQKNI